MTNVTRPLPAEVRAYNSRKAAIPERRKPYVRIQEKDIPDILRLRREGMLLTDIAERYNVSHAAIGRVCNENSVYPAQRIARRHYFWHKDRKELLAEMWNRGDSVVEMARHFGKTEGAIKAQLTVLKEEGVRINLRNKCVRYARKGGTSYTHERG